jgi:hypothetical protein
MKKIVYNLSIVLITVSSFISCNDFLKEENKSGITANPFFTTEAGIESLVNACYTPARFWYGKEGGYAMADLGTDLILSGAGCTHFPIAQYHPADFNSTNTNIKVYWERFYAAINYCNTALNYIPESELSNQTKTIRIGEVSFLRAFYYWHIVETWGGVHFYTDMVTEAQSTANKTPIETFYQQIVEDLNTAIANLPNQASGGRISIPAAEAFKARILLTRASASYTNNADKVKDYSDAAALAKKVINDYNYSLASNYASIWSMPNSNGDNNKEVVWYINYTNDMNLNPDISEYELTNSFRGKDGGHQAHLMFCMKYDDQPGFERDIPYGRPFNRYMPSLRYLQLFDETIDQRYNGSFRSVWNANSDSKVADAQTKGYPRMTKGDTAIYIIKTLATAEQRSVASGKYQLFDARDIYDNEHNAIKNTKQYVELIKFIDPTRSSANEVRSSRDAFVIRIAEMYLIVVEALLQSNPTEALDYMNRLREKRAVSGHEAAMKIALNQLDLDFILDERARELGGEQLRWFDLKRTGKLVDYVKQWNPEAKNNIQSYHQVRPIPQTQLDAVTNKDEFGQNPGYDD